MYTVIHANAKSMTGRLSMITLFISVILLSRCGNNAKTTPPFEGTIFLDPDIITADDPTTFQSLSYTGVAPRKMFDRRVNDWITPEAYLFAATFANGFTVEVQVNPEFSTVDEARAEAEKYATAVGRLPEVLKKDVETFWIHKGTEPFGGGNNNLLIHTGQGALYEADGILEETFVHEACHTSLDAAHASATGWREAQSSDPAYISAYAQENPDREDIAETFLVYLAYKYRRDRISEELANTILKTVPNRMDYFDKQGLDMSPVNLGAGLIVQRPQGG